nr:hypothetical protein [Tanacetum cinerariifolium]
MTVRVSPAMSHDLSAGITEVAAMSNSAFRKRFKSFYDSSPSPTLPFWKRYRCTSELILDTDSKEHEEDEDPAAKDEGLAAGDEGLGMRVNSCGLDDEGQRVESDGLSLGEEEEVVPEDQQQEASVVGTTVSAPLGLGYGALRHRELALREDHVYSTFEVGQGSGSAPEPDRSERTPPSPEWSSGSFPFSPAPSIVPSPISSPLISLIVPSPIASHVVTSIATIPVDEDQFIEIDRDVRELYTRSGAAKGEIFSQRHRFRSLEHEQKRTVMTFRVLWRPVLAIEAWAGRVDTWMIDMLREGRSNRKEIDRKWSQRVLERVVVNPHGFAVLAPSQSALFPTSHFSPFIIPKDFYTNLVDILGRHPSKTLKISIKVEPLLVAFDSQLKIFHTPLNDDTPRKHP